MKISLFTVALAVPVSAGSLLAQRADVRTLGEVSFFGDKGVNVAAIRSALPFHEGDPFPPSGVRSGALVKQVSEVVKQLTGHAATDVAIICCDSKQNYIVYVGLQGASYQELRLNPAPASSVRLPEQAMTLIGQLGDALQKALMSGHPEEDDSTGYMLMKDPGARKVELAMRDYALSNEALILNVLASSSAADHRAAAATLLGYSRQSNEQIDALVRASLDRDGDTRNNAIRALKVLAGARPDLAARIPVEPFVGLLRSGTWTDHNKGSLLLMALTARREPRMLSELRTEALDPLVEMARWRDVGHAGPAVLILGRIAGIPEDSIGHMLLVGEKEKIIGRAMQP